MCLHAHDLSQDSKWEVLVEKDHDVTTAAPLERLSTAEYDRARRVLSRAFVDYPLMQYAMPVASRRLRATTSLYGAILSDCLRHGEVFGVAETSAVACWLPPGTDVPGIARQIRAGMIALPFRFGVRGSRRLLDYDKIAVELHHRYAPEPHWYLAAIGVDMDRQRQGLGSQLLKPQLARADREGHVCYLDTHRESNVRLYERYGFRVMWEGPAPGHPVTVWSMRRDPRA